MYQKLIITAALSGAGTTKAHNPAIPYEPEAFAEAVDHYSKTTIPIDDCEQKFIGTDHAKIGFALAKDWRLPVDVQKGIRDHHKLLQKIEPKSITGIVKIAEYLVIKLEYTLLPDLRFILSKPLLSHLHTYIKDYKAIILDLPEELEKADEIFSLS